MALPGYGGETPLVKYGLTLTVEAPTGTNSTTPVNEGDVFKIGGTAVDGSGYKAVAATNADRQGNAVLVMALHRMLEVQQMGVLVLGKYRGTVRLNYVSGAAPTLGQSVVPSATNVRKVAGVAFDGSNIVLAVNTADLTVEVLV
jgi:hypothetical protein